MSDYEYINNPSHYNKPGKKECIVLMEELFGMYWVAIFCILNCFKYLYRAGDKPDEDYMRDKNKAAWYINRAKGYIPFLKHKQAMKVSNMIILVGEEYDYD